MMQHWNKKGSTLNTEAIKADYTAINKLHIPLYLDAQPLIHAFIQSANHVAAA